MSANKRKPRTSPAASKPATDKRAPQKAQEAAPATGRAEALDNWFRPKLPLLFAVSMALTLLLGLFFFDPKVSIGGDDSTYLNRAWNFIHQGDFPAFQGPFYPILIGLLMTVTGVNVVLFKILSLLFLAGHLWFFYAVFRKYLPPAITGLLLLILGTNHTLLVYGGSTYTEPIYLLLQGLFIWLFDRLILSGAAARARGFGHLKPFLLAGLAFGELGRVLPKINRHMGTISLVSGLLLAIVGVLIYTGGLQLLASAVPQVELETWLLGVLGMGE